jgi:hypothetical protein
MIITGLNMSPSSKKVRINIASGEGDAAWLRKVIAISDRWVHKRKGYSFEYFRTFETGLDMKTLPCGPLVVDLFETDSYDEDWTFACESSLKRLEIKTSQIKPTFLDEINL